MARETSFSLRIDWGRKLEDVNRVFQREQSGGVRGEWSLATMAGKLKRMFALAPGYCRLGVRGAESIQGLKAHPCKSAR